MLRRLISMLIALVFLFAWLPGQVLAAGNFIPASSISGDTAGTSRTSQAAGGSDEELCGRRFYYEQLKAPSKALYDAIAGSDFAYGPKAGSVSADLSSIPVQERTVTSRFTFTTGPDERTYWNTEDGGLVYNEFIEPALAALTFDHPELGWLDGTQARWSWQTDYVPSRSDAQSFVLTSLTYEMGERGYVQATADCAAVDAADRYDCANTEDLAAVRAALRAAKEEIGSLEGSSDSEILRSIHKWLCRNVRYADKTGERFLNGWRGYQTAHSALVQGVTVCAGYSKAFKLLSEEYGVPCVLVEGMSLGQQHMWNYVLIDGSWYGVDCTLDDMDTDQVEETYEYFLRGSEDFGDHVEGCAWDRLPFTYPTVSLGSYRAPATDAGATRHFQFQTVDASDVPIAAMLAEKLETCHDRLEADLKTDLVTPVSVKIYPDVQAMESEGFGTMDGTLAAALCPSTLEIGVLSGRSTQEIAEQAQQAYTMAVLQQKGVDISGSRALARGLALYEAETAREAAAIRADIALGSVPRLADLLQGFWSGEHFDAYCEAAAEFLTESYGFEQLMDVLQGGRLTQVLGSTVKELEQQWTQFLNNIGLSQPSLSEGSSFEIVSSDLGDLLHGLQIGTLMSEVIAAFETPDGCSVQFTGHLGSADGADVPVVTGSQLVLTGTDGTKVILDVVVHGDVLGNGTMSLSQLVAMTSAFAGKKPLTGAFLAAGDWSGTGRINLTDIVRQAELLRLAMS